MAITKLNSLAIPDDTIVEADLSYPLTSFSSTGIDDNATSTAITIDSDENVGIGILPSSTYGRLRVGDNNTDIAMDGNAKGQFHIDGNGFGFGIALNTDGAQIYTNSASRSIIFGTDETERARVDGSGNLLVGKDALGTANEGMQVKPAGELVVTRANNHAFILNRKSSDGDIALFQKDGTTVGSIGVDASDNIYFAGGSGGTKGIYINNAAVYPANTGGSAVDNAVDLGSASLRWKDLYLSGGAYLGGTGSANRMDDYEEGSWTPTTPTGSWTVHEATYTKIGRLVHCRAYVEAGGSGASGDFAGLPFTVYGSYGAGSVGYQNSTGGEVFNILVQANTLFNFRVANIQYGLAAGKIAMLAFQYETT